MSLEDENFKVDLDLVVFHGVSLVFNSCFDSWSLEYRVTVCIVRFLAYKCLSDYQFVVTVSIDPVR